LTAGTYTISVSYPGYQWTGVLTNYFTQTVTNAAASNPIAAVIAGKFTGTWH
jgi:hypothetical protein